MIRHLRRGGSSGDGLLLRDGRAAIHGVDRRAESGAKWGGEEVGWQVCFA